MGALVMNAFIAILLLAAVTLSPIASALPATPQYNYASVRYVVIGPSAGDALRSIGVEPLVDAGNLAAAFLDPREVAVLRERGYRVTLDPVIHLIEPQVTGQVQVSPQSYADLVNATPLHQQGITGNGVIVAVVDTGVDEARPELDGKQAWEYDATQTGQSGYCGKGLGLPYSAHGTMVAGIIFSEGTELRGIAPDATLYDVIIARPELSCGGAYLSDIYNGILAAARGPDGQLGTGDDADVINLSFGTVVLPWNWYYMLDPIDDYSALFAELARLTEQLRHDYGINVVVAAGNAGPATSSVNPFCASALCAGSYSPLGDPSFFSSRGPDPFLRPAPHVMAPGENLTVLLPLELGSTTTASGTSFSAPMASGTLALLRQLLPEADALSLEALLVAGGDPLSIIDWDLVRLGGTRVDAAGAAEKLVAAAFIGEGISRAEAQLPTASLWSGSSLTLQVVNLSSAEVTLVASAQVMPGLLAPGASGQALVDPPSITLPPGGEALITVTASASTPGIAGLLIRLNDADTGQTLAYALASLVEPLKPGERISLETTIYDWGFLPVPLEAPQSGIYSLDIYSYTLPIQTVVWDGTGPDSTPSTLLLTVRAVAYLNPFPFVAAYPMAATTKVDVAFRTISTGNLDEIQARLVELEDRLLLLEARVDALEAEIARLSIIEDELESLRGELELLKAGLETVKAGLEEQSAVNEEQWREINRLSAELQSLASSIDSLRSELRSVREALAVLTARIDTLSLRLDRLQERTVNLENEVNRLSRDLASLSARVDTVEASLAEALQRIASLEEGLDQVKQDLLETQENVTLLNGQIAELNVNLQRLEAETSSSLNELSEGLRQVKESLSLLDKNVNDRLREIDGQLSIVTQTLEELRRSIDELQGQAATIQESLEKVNEKLAAAEEAIVSHEDRIDGLESELAEARKAVEELRKTVEELEKQQDETSNRLAELEEEQRSSRLTSSAALALGAAAGLALLGLAARRLLGGET